MKKSKIRKKVLRAAREFQLHDERWSVAMNAPSGFLSVEDMEKLSGQTYSTKYALFNLLDKLHGDDGRGRVQAKHGKDF